MLNQWSRQGLIEREENANRSKSFDGGSSKGRCDIHDKTRFKKRFCNHAPYKLPNTHDDRVSNPMSKKGRDTTSPSKKQTCG